MSARLRLFIVLFAAWSLGTALIDNFHFQALLFGAAGIAILVYGVAFVLGTPTIAYRTPRLPYWAVYIMFTLAFVVAVSLPKVLLH